jgi:tetratricopeptide (TPR) repeat protein
VEPQLAQLRSGPPRVGVYFRHGQGEFLRGRLDQVLFPEHEQMYAELRARYPRRALDVAALSGLERPAFFVSSDSEDFVRQNCAALPNSMAFAGVRPDRNFKDHLIASKQDPAILASAAQDMWGLSLCRSVLAVDSLFPYFAMLNSETLGEADLHHMEAPTFVSFLDSLGPDEALERAEQAYWSNDSLLTTGLYVRALRRVRERRRADEMQLRANWHREMIVDVPLRNADLDATERRFRDAVAALREFDWEAPPNPYALALLASVLLQEGDLPAAEQALARAMWVDPGISRVNALLAQLRGRQGDVAAATAAATVAASTGRLDRTTTELMNRLTGNPGLPLQAA